MQRPDKPTHQFHATIHAGGQTFEKVPVKVYLPQRMAEPIRLVLCPSKAHARNLMNHFEFSLRAEVVGFSRKVERLFEAKRVYSESGTTKAWSLDLEESEIEAVPYDFALWGLRDHPDGAPSEVSGRFWLTPCQLLEPAQFVTRSFTGDIKVKTGRQLKFRLKNELRLTFDFVHRHVDLENGDRLSFTELVANFKDKTNIVSVKAIPERCLSFLDDFLLIVSFAARQRCICLGWEAWDSACDVTFYRRDFTIPKAKVKTSHNDTLIDVSQFEAFVTSAYTRFLEIEPKQYFRQALYAITAGEKTVETKFTRLFSALETLVLKHRRDKKNETIFTSDEWQGVRKDIETFIKTHSTFASDKAKRKQIYEKLSELNRVSFATAFADFCESYKIQLDDLWPVSKNGETVSLATIRNRLAHGEPLDQRQLQVVAIATHHLEWTLERIILAVFEWPSADSRVSSHYLRHMIPYNNWAGSTLD